MKISAITRFKQGDLFGLLRKLDWSQNELSRRCGINSSTIGEYINLKKRPSKCHAEKIANAFAESGEFLDLLAVWPETFAGTGLRHSLSIVQTQDVPEDKLLGFEQYKQIENSSDFGEEEFSKMEELVSALDQREQQILKERFSGQTLDEIANRFDISRERVRQIVKRSVRRLREEMTKSNDDYNGLIERIDQMHNQQLIDASNRRKIKEAADLVWTKTLDVPL